MTFLFDCSSSNDIYYVNANDLNSAIEIFKSHYESVDSDQLHIYVRIV